MNVLHVTYIDLPGRRFNGYDLMDDLQSRGVTGAQAVLEKQSADPRVLSLFANSKEDLLRQSIARVERNHSMDSLLFPWGRTLAQTPQFEEADIVHYQVIQNRMISILDLPMLTARKPSVWTLHDPWPLTGHCVHPQGCDGWRTGCAPCPYLDRMFALAEDRAGDMWRIKRDIYSDLDVDIVVASEFMEDMVRQSPLTAHLDRVHRIPFGIDASLFLPDSEKMASRAALGIPEDHFVLLLRASSWDVKGLRYIIEALSAHPPRWPTTLLTVDRKGLLAELTPAYNVVDLGWVDDDMQYPRAFCACDVFLMPSTAESFGLMALEAMAAARPVVCFQDTAVASVIHAPDCGIAVPLRDAGALREAIDHLAENPGEAQRRGAAGRVLAEGPYSHETYLDSMADLYRSVEARTHAGA